MASTPALKPHERIFVGLDTPDIDKAARLAKALIGAVGGVKIGKELFTAQGPYGVRMLGVARPKVIGVTVLTSLDEKDLEEVGQKGPAKDQVKRLALLAQDSGLDGVVCSAKEIELLRKACGPDFLLVVPGIRPAWSVAGDQKRIMTPEDAVAAGADHIVIGRPITAAEDPLAAARRIAADLDAAGVTA